MLNEAIRFVNYAIFASAAFVVAVVLSVVIPEAIRRRWPIAMGIIAAAAVVAVEKASEEQA